MAFSRRVCMGGGQPIPPVKVSFNFNYNKRFSMNRKQRKYFAESFSDAENLRRIPKTDYRFDDKSTLIANSGRWIFMPPSYKKLGGTLINEE